MCRFRIGDEAKVVASSSQWREMHGQVEAVIECRAENGEIRQECAVEFDAQRCWFLAEHLVKTIPPRLVHFFRYEAARRWKFDSQEASLSGDCDELVSLLKSHHGFAARRAQVEADDFFDTFLEKVRTATDVGAPVESGASVFDPKKEIAAA